MAMPLSQDNPNINGDVRILDEVILREAFVLGYGRRAPTLCKSKAVISSVLLDKTVDKLLFYPKLLSCATVA